MSCSSDEQSDKECPLCMEQLEIDDLDFYPCKCEYQICRFCWHRLLTDENGLCPACRQPYPEDPVTFKPLSCADVQRIKDEKPLKKEDANLVYVVGLSPRVADPDTLRKPEYFGRFGKILKVVVGTAPTANHPHAQPSHTAYVTYSKVEEALRAIQPLSCADVQRIKDEKRLKQQAEKLRISESRNHLANYRVLQKNLVYVVGLSPRVADPDTLRKPEYFGRFGKILKVVVGTAPTANHPHAQPSHTAYVTYSKVEEALRAIQECMYLHEIADSDISFTKEDMHMGKHAEYERRLIDTVLNRSSTQPQEKRAQPWGSNKNNICWDQNGSETSEEADHGRDGGYNGGDESPSGDPTPSEAFGSRERQSSTQDKENIPKRGKVKQGASSSANHTPAGSTPPSSSPPREPTPPSLDYKAPQLESVSEAKPPPSKTVEQSKPFNSIYNQDTESKLLRLLCGNEDNGAGMIPAPAPVSEAPAPLVNWQTLLGLSPQATAGNNATQTSYASSTLHPSTTPQKSLVSTPPPGLGGFTSDDDLGFDPFSESSKGLARLLEEEEKPQHRQQFDPYCAPPPGLTPPQRSAMSSQSISDWQEGLKALLPNVNVRFVSDLEGAHNGSSLHHLHQQHAAAHHSSFGARWPPSAYGLDVNGRTNPHHIVPHAVPPPPGFSVPNR
ncbi:hypothetical protein OSTOST_03908 [Ostertagia ostertagi]